MTRSSLPFKSSKHLYTHKYNRSPTRPLKPIELEILSKCSILYWQRRKGYLMHGLRDNRKLYDIVCWLRQKDYILNIGYRFIPTKKGFNYFLNHRNELDLRYFDIENEINKDGAHEYEHIIKRRGQYNKTKTKTRPSNISPLSVYQ